MNGNRYTNEKPLADLERAERIGDRDEERERDRRRLSLVWTMTDADRGTSVRVDRSHVIRMLANLGETDAADRVFDAEEIALDDGDAHLRPRRKSSPWSFDVLILTEVKR